MPTGKTISRNLLVFMACIGLVTADRGFAQQAVLHLERTITLPGITGKFDHLAFDGGRNRLFAAATGSHAVAVIDLRTGSVTQMLSNLGKPHGVFWLSETGRLFVADGEPGSLRVFSGDPLRQIANLPLSQDADDMAYDASRHLLFVGHGGSDAANHGSIAVMDADKLTLVRDLRAQAHPEALEADPGTDRVFANIADAGQVAVIDAATQSIAATWSLKGVSGNTPLALDKDDGLLILGCRTPAVLITLDAKTGRQVGSATSDAGADDVFFDPSARRVYLSTGAGFIDVYQIAANGALTSAGRVKTEPGAKTSLFVSSRAELFVGIPGVGGNAEVRIYAVR